MHTQFQHNSCQSQLRYVCKWNSPGSFNRISICVNVIKPIISINRSSEKMCFIVCVCVVIIIVMEPLDKVRVCVCAIWSLFPPEEHTRNGQAHSSKVNMKENVSKNIDSNNNNNNSKNWNRTFHCTITVEWKSHTPVNRSYFFSFSFSLNRCFIVSTFAWMWMCWVDWSRKIAVADSCELRGDCLMPA